MARRIVDGKTVSDVAAINFGGATTLPVTAPSAASANESTELAELRKQLAEKNAEVEALKQAKAAPRSVGITFCVTKPHMDAKTGKMTKSTGAVSLYGFGQWPITLYPAQWERLAAVFAGTELCGVKGNANAGQHPFWELFRAAKAQGVLNYKE